MIEEIQDVGEETNLPQGKFHRISYSTISHVKVKDVQPNPLRAAFT